MITIKEIAKQLNMSTTTVSNVIHGKTGEVSPQTIRRVREFLKEVGYVPNINARNLAQNQSKIIGLVIKSQPERYINLLEDPFVSAMIAGIEEQIKEAGYYMMIYMSDDIAEIINHVSTWNVDGLLLFWMLDDDGIRVSERYKKPVVCIDTYSQEGKLHFFNVGLDDEEGAYNAVSYLIKCGHRKIGFLSDNKSIGVDQARFKGFRRALREAGIEYSDRSYLLIRSEKDEIDKSIDKICRRVTDYTAVFCVSDLFAVILMAALADRGIKVPDDISVVGFDDNLFGRLHRPALTTVHQDPVEKGRIAAGKLLGIIAGEEPENGEIIMKSSLVIRDTVRNLTGGEK